MLRIWGPADLISQRLSEKRILQGFNFVKDVQSLHLDREKTRRDSKVQIQFEWEEFVSGFQLKVGEICSKTFLGQYFIFVLCIIFIVETESSSESWNFSLVRVFLSSQ